MPKQGQGLAFQTEGPELRDMALGKREAHLGEQLVPRVAKASSSK